MDSDIPEEFEVKVWMHQGSVLSPFLFAVVVDVTELAKGLMSETIIRLRNKFMKCKVAFERNGLKVKIWKNKVMISGDIPRDGMSKSKVHLCGVCSLRVKVYSVL